MPKFHIDRFKLSVQINKFNKMDLTNWKVTIEGNFLIGFDVYRNDRHSNYPNVAT